MKNHMAIDQHGETFHNLGSYPRKELLNRLDRKKAEKMYIDQKNGRSFHVGYIIAKHWLTIYEVIRMEKTR